MLAITSDLASPARLTRPHSGGSPFCGRIRILLRLLRAHILTRFEGMKHCDGGNGASRLLIQLRTEPETGSGSCYTVANAFSIQAEFVVVVVVVGLGLRRKSQIPCHLTPGSGVALGS